MEYPGKRRSQDPTREDSKQTKKDLWQGKILAREDPMKGKIFGKRRS
jgi:hypothetical protein